MEVEGEGKIYFDELLILQWMLNNSHMFVSPHVALILKRALLSAGCFIKYYFMLLQNLIPQKSLCLF